MKVYRRIEAGKDVETVSVREGLDEINHAMMGGRRNVKAMSSVNRNDYVINYRDGRTVRLTQVEQPEPVEVEATETEAWSTAGAKMLLHRFTSADADGRAVCNKRFRPWRYGNGYSFRTLAEWMGREHADLYTVCPRCSSK